ncbi:interferon-induced, double-stranded RNA-activated protein kinase isoform X2 [Notolabrus celidotus]|uniref:interferon-induced, double-stranded RNA-activated protein kinase isoform X2 n=1 Tax=Notolabrus celidotus TaxID=1203425 RepID=UPI0014902D30|nr:interferon-induced, double-stranded RNA-activated protein kinase isoform X2 [Notolabrus celidotus]
MMEGENYVAKLNEFGQRTPSVIRYEDVGVEGPDHIRTYTVRVTLNGKAYPEGVGNSKKEAKKNAAKNAWIALMKETTETSEKTAEVSVTPVQQTNNKAVNFVSWLNEYGNKTRLLVKPVESTREGANSAFHFVVGDKEYPVAIGKNKKEAKEEAAKLVYHEICGNKTTETEDEKSSGVSSRQEEELNIISDKKQSPSVVTKGVDVTDSNYIALLNNYCQKTKRFHDYIFEKRSGPAHSPLFYYRVTIDKKEYPVAEGKNVKEAKQNAAQLAWSAFQEQSDFDSKLSLGCVVSDEVTAATSSTPSRTPSSDTNSKSAPTTSSDSFIVFSNPSTPAKDQSPAVKPKIKLAANFKNAHDRSKEDMVNFNCKKDGNSLSEKSSNQSVTSRFTLEFDSINLLGKGGFGFVFKARRKLEDKLYAVKVVHWKQKALREVAALSDLNHSNIVRYYTCWLEDSEYHWEGTADSFSSSQSTGNSEKKCLYIQMELCENRTLKEWIDEKNMQNSKKSQRSFKRREESLCIALQIVGGVEYFHSMNFIHRDLKPANIMFGRNGEVKIGDFGLVTNENDDDDNLVERTERKGTRSYMAPEQMSGKTYDKKVDIFALGLIYFELLWYVSTYMERKAIWNDVRTQKPPQGFSHKFPLESQIIKSMLSVKPEDRPEASQLKTELEEGSRILTARKDAHRDNRTF